MANQVSEYLIQHQEKILKTWEARAKKEVAAARHQESLALQNSLPEYLAQIATALSTTINRTELRVQFDLAESTRVGKKHGSERAGTVHYTMDQLIYEYHILRQVIFDVIEEEINISDMEREIITCSIEKAVNDAATQFSETLSDIQEYLLDTLAHDLRSPIAAAKMGAQLILRRPEEVELNIKTASRIANTMDRLDSMIHDLLDASRLRAGQGLQLQFEECDLETMAKQIASEFKYTHEREFLVKTPGPTIGNWCKNALTRAIENLLSNAVKYGSKNTPITITLKKHEETVCLMIHNHGNPIPKNEQLILFEQFRRSKTAEAEAGWGLGLTVVKGIVKAHFGKISVESSEAAGTLFSIELPLRAVKEGAV